MTAKELQQIYLRFYNSPDPIDKKNERQRYNINLSRRKPSKRPGVIIWDKGTFRGSIRNTFKLM